MQPKITEIAPDVYRICTHVEAVDLQFSQFLVKDDEPLLFHTGLKKMFPLVREAVAKLIDPTKLRWIGYSHFEPDECGSLNEWLALAPQAQAVCSVVSSLVNLADYADREARGLQRDEVLETGKRRFRFKPTPHLPHGWDAGVLFEETERVLLCSDLFHQLGDVAPTIESATTLLERARQTYVEYDKGPLMSYMPYTTNTRRLLQELAALEPRTLAPMHGSAFVGDGAAALVGLAEVMKETMGAGAEPA